MMMSSVANAVVPERIEWEALSTREQTSLLKQSFYEAIKVFNSEAMKKY